MPSIDIDFEVFKLLTGMRVNESHSYNEVLREIMGLPVSTSMTGLSVRGVLFPNGTRFRHVSKTTGKTYTGEIRNNKLVADGKETASLSNAATHVSGSNMNGWKFWEVCLPGKDRWVLAETLREDD